MEKPKLSLFVCHQYGSPQSIQRYHYSQPAVGYVSSGRKVFHTPDGVVLVESGELFHVEAGEYEVENLVSAPGESFRQSLFFYDAPHLCRSFISQRSVERAQELCRGCRHGSSIYHYPGWSSIHRFFEGAERASTVLASSEVLSHMKLCELLHLLLERPDCCVCHPLSRAYLDR